jgi:hypothetical protein
VEKLDHALARFNYDRAGPCNRWRKLDPDVLWVLSLHGRIGFGVVDVRHGDRVDPLGAGWERALHWEAPQPGRTAYAVFYADGCMVTDTRFYRPSKAVEVGLAALLRCENMTSKDTATR